jgi:signal peptidase I
MQRNRESMSLQTNANNAADSGWRETIKIVVHALILAMIVRIFFYQPFNIPSGSMKSTLLVGDYLFVSKLSYGYSRYSFPWAIIPFKGRIFAAEPNRGDVAVFKLPRDNSTDYIKRVIGLPGDEIAVRDGVLYINGQAVPKVRKDDFVAPEEGRPIPRFEETLPNGVKYLVLDSVQGGQFDNVSGYKVPPGHYFMMGDNRDNSTDSREQSPRYGVGYVPYENLVGRAEIIFFSAAVDDPNAFRLTSPWTWPLDIRWGRIFSLVR